MRGICLCLLHVTSFASAPVYPSVKTVHVINSCHLDLGFADSSVNIVNRYFDHHLLAAVSVGEELRRGVAGYTDDKLGFMFQSWIIDIFLNCPSGMGLHCPDSDSLAKVRSAITKGDITWHAFPFNAQLEVMDPALIKAGLELTFALDSTFMQPRKRTLSQRDVPGLTRAAIPILKSKGVLAMSVGANEGSTPADVPPCFMWRDRESNTTIIVLYSWPGYGSLPLSHQRSCVVDGFEHALVYNWNEDNAGPSSAADYGKTWRSLAKSYPNAKIVASTFDNFIQHLETIADRLPSVDQEIGDTWMYGVPSDPQKVSRMRVINRAFATLDSQTSIERILSEEDVLRNATRFFLTLGEHTWGKDVKSVLSDNSNWKNLDFERARVEPTTASQYAALEASWWEQRHWGITIGMEALTSAPTAQGFSYRLASMIREGFTQLQPEIPVLAGYRLAHAGDEFKCGKIEIGFDSSGAISHLVHDGKVWAEKLRTLLQMKYRSYSAADVASFFSTYVMSNASWVQHDYGKPGLPHDVLGKVWTPHLQNLYVKQTRGACSFVAQSAFTSDVSINYGAAAAWITIDLADDKLQVSIRLFNKTTTRLPEAMFVQWNPVVEQGKWSVNKLGAWIRVDDVVNGGSKHLHGNMEAGVRVEDSSGRSMFVSALDAAVVNFGKLTAYPSSVHEDPDTSGFGSSFVMWDNLWGTNYVMWWPFVVPPPQVYSSSSTYFPTSWNNDIISRFNVTFSSPIAGSTMMWV